jgi:hypothetical protein
MHIWTETSSILHFYFLNYAYIRYKVRNKRIRRFNQVIDVVKRENVSAHLQLSWMFYIYFIVFFLSIGFLILLRCSVTVHKRQTM